jgi:hypothetical protein
MGGRLVLLFCEWWGFINQFSILCCEWEAYFWPVLLYYEWVIHWSVFYTISGRLIDLLTVLGVEGLLTCWLSWEWKAYCPVDCPGTGRLIDMLIVLGVEGLLTCWLSWEWKAYCPVDCPGSGRLIDMLIVLGVESLLRRYTSVFVRERHIDYDWFLLALYVLSLERISWCLYVFVYFTCSGYIYPMILF